MMRIPPEVLFDELARELEATESCTLNPIAPAQATNALIPTTVEASRGCPTGKASWELEA